MTDAPSPHELSRRIDGLTAMLAQLVQRAEYTADHRLIDRRFVEVEADIAAIRADVADLRRQLAADMKELKVSLDAVAVRQEAAAEKRGSNVRQAIYAGILPAAFLLLGFAVQIWIALRGSP